ncbi:hypothetical protein HF1_13200 [Mycoplasma haemofelis str. Langford 1]|uniref:Uncharacterized protein n=1 Tax=Mycoplasma haemofelis (strain Langford 1) TaxID=941640 RepID=E8ZJK7_MYCHL|nr:hypothetical protein [Mycoplasma haemofelis]CBY93328.1 hypothetical protein HF1_13200 [Mycoplasma haemofelis str. Langford 1]
MKFTTSLLGGTAVLGTGVAGSYLYVAPQSKTEIVEEEKKNEIEKVSLTSTWKGPRFLSRHHFSGLSLSFSQGIDTNFKDSVNGTDPKIKGKYYVEWVGDDWENHVRNLKSRKDDSAVKAIFKEKELSADSLRDTCNSLSSKSLKIDQNSNLVFDGKGEITDPTLKEWKDAVLVCTRTIRLGDYLKVEGQEIITDASQVSSGALKLREEDEKTTKDTSMTYGKEFLQDRLRGLSDEEVKVQIFEWCQYLGNKAASTGTWNNDKDNFRDFCMRSKNAVNVESVSPSENTKKVDDKKGQGSGTVGEYLEKNFLTASGGLGHKKFVSSAQEISDSVYRLREDDEKNYESLSMRGKEFLQDRLKEKSLELIKEEVFSWCNFLKTRPSEVKERNLENLRTYCLVDKNPQARK